MFESYVFFRLPRLILRKSVVRCACIQKPAGFGVEIFFFGLTQFVTKAGRICDKEVFFCLYSNKKLLIFTQFPALILAKELDISLDTP